MSPGGKQESWSKELDVFFYCSCFHSANTKKEKSYFLGWFLSPFLWTPWCVSSPQQIYTGAENLGSQQEENKDLTTYRVWRVRHQEEPENNPDQATNPIKGCQEKMVLKGLTLWHRRPPASQGAQQCNQREWRWSRFPGLLRSLWVQHTMCSNIINVSNMFTSCWIRTTNLTTRSTWFSPEEEPRHPKPQSLQGRPKREKLLKTHGICNSPPHTPSLSICIDMFCSYMT